MKKIMFTNISNSMELTLPEGVYTQLTEAIRLHTVKFNFIDNKSKNKIDSIYIDEAVNITPSQIKFIESIIL